MIISSDLPFNPQNYSHLQILSQKPQLSSVPYWATCGTEPRCFWVCGPQWGLLSGLVGIPEGWTVQLFHFDQWRRPDGMKECHGCASCQHLLHDLTIYSLLAIDSQMTAMWSPLLPHLCQPLASLSTTMPAMDRGGGWRGQFQRAWHRADAFFIGMRASIDLNQLLKLKGLPLIIVHGWAEMCPVMKRCQTLMP